MWALAWAAGPYLPRLAWRTPEAELGRFARRALPPLLEEGFARMQNSCRVPLGCAPPALAHQRSHAVLGCWRAHTTGEVCAEGTCSSALHCWGGRP